jgi:hypothetical protein
MPPSVLLQFHVGAREALVVIPAKNFFGRRCGTGRAYFTVAAFTVAIPVEVIFICSNGEFDGAIFAVVGTAFLTSIIETVIAELSASIRAN